MTKHKSPARYMVHFRLDALTSVKRRLIVDGFRTDFILLEDREEKAKGKVRAKGAT